MLIASGGLFESRQDATIAYSVEGLDAATIACMMSAQEFAGKLQAWPLNVGGPGVPNPEYLYFGEQYIQSKVPSDTCRYSIYFLLQEMISCTTKNLVHV